MREELKSLLDQFKIICGGEPPRDVWSACLTLNGLPDIRAVFELWCEIMANVQDPEMQGALEYLDGHGLDRDKGSLA